MFLSTNFNIRWFPITHQFSNDYHKQLESWMIFQMTRSDFNIIFYFFVSSHFNIFIIGLENFSRPIIVLLNTQLFNWISSTIFSRISFKIYVRTGTVAYTFKSINIFVVAYFMAVFGSIALDKWKKLTYFKSNGFILGVKIHQ